MYEFIISNNNSNNQNSTLPQLSIKDEKMIKKSNQLSVDEFKLLAGTLNDFNNGKELQPITLKNFKVYEYCNSLYSDFSSFATVLTDDKKSAELNTIFQLLNIIKWMTDPTLINLEDENYKKIFKTAHEKLDQERKNFLNTQKEKETILCHQLKKKFTVDEPYKSTNTIHYSNSFFPLLYSIIFKAIDMSGAGTLLFPKKLLTKQTIILNTLADLCILSAETQTFTEESSVNDVYNFIFNPNVGSKLIKLELNNLQQLQLSKDLAKYLANMYNLAICLPNNHNVSTDELTKNLISQLSTEIASEESLYGHLAKYCRNKKNDFLITLLQETFKKFPEILSTLHITIPPNEEKNNSVFKFFFSSKETEAPLSNQKNTGSQNTLSEQYLHCFSSAEMFNSDKSLPMATTIQEHLTALWNMNNGMLKIKENLKKYDQDIGSKFILTLLETKKTSMLTKAQQKFLTDCLEDKQIFNTIATELSKDIGNNECKIKGILPYITEKKGLQNLQTWLQSFFEKNDNKQIKQTFDLFLSLINYLKENTADKLNELIFNQLERTYNYELENNKENLVNWFLSNIISICDINNAADIWFDFLRPKQNDVKLSSKAIYIFNCIEPAENKIKLLESFLINPKYLESIYDITIFKLQSRLLALLPEKNRNSAVYLQVKAFIVKLNNLNNKIHYERKKTTDRIFVVLKSLLPDDIQISDYLKDICLHYEDFSYLINNNFELHKDELSILELNNIFKIVNIIQQLLKQNDISTDKQILTTLFQMVNVRRKSLLNELNCKKNKLYFKLYLTFFDDLLIKDLNKLNLNSYFSVLYILLKKVMPLNNSESQFYKTLLSHDQINLLNKLISNKVISCRYIGGVKEIFSLQKIYHLVCNEDLNRTLIKNESINLEEKKLSLSFAEYLLDMYTLAAKLPNSEFEFSLSHITSFQSAKDDKKRFNCLTQIFENKDENSFAKWLIESKKFNSLITVLEDQKNNINHNRLIEYSIDQLFSLEDYAVQLSYIPHDSNKCF